ncbi:MULTISPECIES: RRXRR domain-containing protein [Bacteria]|uniref:RRXRR domain-containing protein n=1 Tax=Thermaceae TaxID=188786 RepID=UPI00019E9A49|nr:RRXRR domain-containing protein [Meiothermus ruber]
MVFVLDKRKKPLMPCSEKRARFLLTRGRAFVVLPILLRVPSHLNSRLCWKLTADATASKSSGMTLSFLIVQSVVFFRA